MDDLLALFFDVDKPCPEKIPNCLSLRESYKADVEKYVLPGTCNSCALNGIRQKYITFILALTNS